MPDLDTIAAYYDTQLNAMRARYEKSIDYSIALQRAIEHCCRGEELPARIAAECPHHATILSDLRNKFARLRNLLGPGTTDAECWTAEKQKEVWNLLETKPNA